MIQSSQMKFFSTAQNNSRFQESSVQNEIHESTTSSSRISLSNADVLWDELKACKKTSSLTLYVSLCLQDEQAWLSSEMQS